jgi:bifunctional non-homologous end joining protein LigD
MPTHIVPMLATLSEMPGDQSGYGFEYKWDGIRGMFFLGGERWRLETRNLIDVSHAYPEMIGLVDALADTRVVLDGEVITFDEKGSPSFGRLQHRLGIGEKKAKMLQAEFPVTYMIFDVLYLEGYTLMGLPFSERRDILEELGLEGAHWRTPPCYRGEGMPVLEAARENHLEGVMAKRLEGLYHPGLRTGDWRKIKLVDRQEFVVGGWTPISTGTKAMGALLVGYYEPAHRNCAAGTWCTRARSGRGSPTATGASWRGLSSRGVGTRARSRMRHPPRGCILPSPNSWVRSSSAAGRTRGTSGSHPSRACAWTKSHLTW